MRVPVGLLSLGVLCVLLASCAGATASTSVSKQSSTTPSRPVVPTVYYATVGSNLNSGSSSAIVALNAADGAVRWHYAPGHDVSAPFSLGNLVYTKSSNGLNKDSTLTALDSATGAVVWSAPSGSYPTTAPTANGVVYLTIGGMLECRDATTGRLRWQRQTAFGKLTVTSSTVYSTFTSVTRVGAPVSSSLTAYDTANGAVRWTFLHEHEGFTEPVSSDGVVYISGRTSRAPDPDSGRLYALNATSGSLLWSVDAPATTTSVVVSHGTVYVGGSANGIIAYRTNDGAHLWQNTDPLLGRFAAVGSTVYITTFRNAVVALDSTTGAQLWTTAVDELSSAPIFANGLLYVTSGNEKGNVVAINAATGAIAWKQKLEATPGPMILAGGMLYTYSYEPSGGSRPILYAFDAARGTVRWQHTPDQIIVPGGLAVSGT